MTPMVTAIMLTKHRAKMAARAVAAFQAQTYERKQLFILDSGGTDRENIQIGVDLENPNILSIITHERDAATNKKLSIGALRNAANHFAQENIAGWESSDIFVHFDDDDYSHPERIADQVVTLQASGKKAVGYREVLFWDTRPGVDTITCECGEIWSQHVATVCPKCAAWPAHRGKAWLFSHEDPRYFIGSSMCYWRSAWESCKFDDAPHEDARWFRANAAHCAGFSSLAAIPPAPRMICSIHGGNTEAYALAEMAKAQEWQRAPEYDGYCRERMKLEGV